MLSTTNTTAMNKSDLMTINKENESTTATHVLKPNKRQHALITTPMTNKTLPTKKSQTPGSALKNPILRDITNSANPLRTGDIYPPGERPSLPPTSAAKKPKNSKPAMESKLRISEPFAAQHPTIEQLLRLPDDQLPDIERVAPPCDVFSDKFEISDLPPIEDITETRVEQFSLLHLERAQEIVEAAERERLVLQERITEAIRNLVIDPAEFHWAYDKITVNYDGDGDVSSDGPPPCFMFDDIPGTVDVIN